MTKPRVGIDFHMTLADSGALYRRYYNRRHRQHGHTTGDIPLGVLDASYSFPEYRCERCFETVYGERSQRAPRYMPPMPGALEAVRELAKTFDLYLLSHCHSAAHEGTTAWFELHGIADCFVDYLYTRGPKSAVVKREGFITLVDDSPAVLSDLRAHGVEPIAFPAGYNADWTGVRATDWYDVVDLLLDAHYDRAVAA